jgi:hypothetical protein
MKIERFINDIHIPTGAKYFSTQELLFSSNKGEVNILRGEKHFDFKNLPLM